MPSRGWGLREGAVPRWIGVLAALPVLQTTLMVAGMGVPGVPALLGPIWLVVTGLGLYLSTSRITEPAHGRRSNVGHGRARNGTTTQSTR